MDLIGTLGGHKKSRGTKEVRVHKSTSTRVNKIEPVIERPLGQHLENAAILSLDKAIESGESHQGCRSC
jgi:hypothetical protein